MEVLDPNQPFVSRHSVLELSDEDIGTQLDQILKKVEALEAEIAIFGKSLAQHDYHERQRSESTYPGAKKDPAIFHHKRKSHVESDKDSILTVEQKSEIALRELADITTEIRKYASESVKSIATYEALIGEADFCLSDIVKETTEFEREIAKSVVSPFTKAIKAERCIQYFEEKLKVREAYMKKLILKNSNTRVKEKRLKLQLKQKEKIGEVLNEVDFNQLKIMHEQYIQKLAERSQDLMGLKLTAGATLQVLNMFKKKVTSLAKEANQVQTELGTRSDLLRRTEAEAHQIEMERLQAERANKILSGHITKFEVPTIMEYVMKKSEVYNNHQTIKIWERRLTMAENDFKNCMKIWKRLRLSVSVLRSQDDSIMST